MASLSAKGRSASRARASARVAPHQRAQVGERAAAVDVAEGHVEASRLELRVEGEPHERVHPRPSR